MDLMWALYLIEVLNSLNGVVIFVGILSSATLTFIALGSSLEDLKVASKTIKIILTTVLVSAILAITIPSKQTMYSMLALQVSKDVIANPKVQETTDKVLKLVNQKLDEMLDTGKKK